jgi:hypothetical protein
MRSEPDRPLAEAPATATGRPRAADHGVSAIVVKLVTGRRPRTAAESPLVSCNAERSPRRP